MIDSYIEQEHHYVPRGYFRPWENADRKVVVYQRKNGHVLPPYLQSTKSICVKPGLYAYTDSVKPEVRNVLEETLFQRIDSEAARVLGILNKCDSISDVSNEDIHAFAFFLASLRIRTPEFFEMYSKSTGRRLRKLVFDSEDDPDLRDSILENKGREFLAKDLMSGKLVNAISGMRWTIISIPEQVGISLLTSDRPLISNWANKDMHLLALPISPSRAIVASSNHAEIDHIMRFNKRRFAEVMNISTTEQAQAKAFAADKSHSLRFFERRLGVRHSTLPFAASFDPELIDRRIEEAAQAEVRQATDMIAQLARKAIRNIKDRP